MQSRSPIRSRAARFDHDRWLLDAATSAAARHEAEDPRLPDAAQVRRPSPETLTVVSRLAEHHARGGPVETIGARSRPSERPTRRSARRSSPGSPRAGRRTSPRARRRRRASDRRPPAEARDRLPRADARPRLALGLEGAGRLRRSARQGLPRRRGRPRKPDAAASTPPGNSSISARRRRRPLAM